MNIRRVAAGDGPAWQRVFAAVADEDRWIGVEPPAPDRGEEMEARFVDSDDDVMLLAEVDGDVVGWISGESKPDGAIELGMGVCARFRGRGIGAALLEALLGWAGARRVVLRVFPHNERALALYRQFGFVLLEHKAGVWPRRNGEFWDLLFMERPADR
ncbi:MAG TPA: GNAT family N-acetyltransferase [Acidimicrobiales bacterium]|nr:GNAT family N-acetyltransferase [Acidimicrobiales bacterium]